MHYLRNWKHPLYSRWSGMMDRCNNPKNQKYANYGGRGIKVCERWHNFNNFLADIGAPPSLKHTLDRINNDGDYEPNNVRWATYTEQNFNQRMNRRNRSGITGVYFDRTRNKWTASIKFLGKDYRLGRFDTKQEAVNARKQFEVDKIKEAVV